MQRALLILAMLLWVMSRSYLLFDFQPIFSDTGHYFKFVYAQDYQDKIPYRDIKIEYPPIAWWIISAPRLIEKKELTTDRRYINSDLKRYQRHFRMLMCVFDLAGFLLFLRIILLRKHTSSGFAAIAYVVLTTLLGHLLLDRLDVVLLFLFMLWCICWQQSAGARISLWGIGSYAALGMGVSFKLIPIIVLPILFIGEWRQYKSLLRSIVNLMSFLVFAMGPFVYYYYVAGSSVFDLFSYHADRGIQIESIYSSFALVLSFLGMDVSAYSGSGSWNLLSSIDVPLKVISSLGLAVFLMVIYLLTLCVKEVFSRDKLYILVLLSVSGAIILSKVFSPQYLIWGFPILLLLGAEFLVRSHYIGLIAALIIIACASTWLFPYNYFSYLTKGSSAYVNTMGLVPDLNWQAKIILLIRNAIYLMVVVWLVIKYTNQRRRAG